MFQSATKSSVGGNTRPTLDSARKSRLTLGTKTINILEMSKESKKDFFTSFNIVFCACDGVVWMMSGGEIPQVGPALVLLKEWGKEIIFVSNNSMRKDRDYIDKFNAIGFSDVNPQPEVDLCTEDLLEKISPDDHFDAVVLDVNLNITFGELMRAQQYLVNDNCVLLVGASDSRLPISKGFKALGSFGFMNMLAQCTGQEPLVFGKPGAQLAEYLIERFKLADNPTRALIIGANLRTDIGFGNTYNFQTLFVPTGAYTVEEAKRLPENLQPDYFARSLADFKDFFDDIKSFKEEWRKDSKLSEERESQSRRSSEKRNSDSTERTRESSAVKKNVY